MEKPLLSPKNDYVFHKLFGREECKSQLLSLLRSIVRDDIVDIVYYPRDLEKEDSKGKGSVLDILAITDQKVRIDIEMQVIFNEEYISRVLFYGSRLFSSQVSKGNEYMVLRKTICITILNDTNRFFPHFHSTFHIYEDSFDPVMKLTDLLEFHFIDMLRIEKEGFSDFSEPLKMWIAFLASDDENVLQDVAAKNPCIKRAYKMLQELSQDEVERIEAIRRERAIIEESLIRGTAREQGIEIGEKKGRKEGIKIGEKKGKIEGLIEAAKKMIDTGMDPKVVCKTLDLSESDLR